MVNGSSLGPLSFFFFLNLVAAELNRPACKSLEVQRAGGAVHPVRSITDVSLKRLLVQLGDPEILTTTPFSDSEQWVA